MTGAKTTEAARVPGEEDGRAADKIREELEQAETAEAQLAEEAAGIRERLRATASDEKGALQAAVTSGKGLKDSSPFLRAQRRAQELPALLWAASVRKLELAVELEGCLMADAKREQDAASKIGARPGQGEEGGRGALPEGRRAGADVVRHVARSQPPAGRGAPRARGPGGPRAGGL
jgi:hypothetical protein